MKIINAEILVILKPASRWRHWYSNIRKDIICFWRKMYESNKMGDRLEDQSIASSIKIIIAALVFAQLKLQLELRT